MKKHQISIWVFFTSAILLTGFKKNTEGENIFSNKPADINNHVVILPDPIKVSIAETSVIKSDKGQRPLKVMMYLSRTTTEPVTVKYSTEDGSAKAGVDYVATSGSVTFEPGEAAKWITVSIIGDVAADPDEDAPVIQTVKFTINMIPQTIGVIVDVIKGYITVIQNIAVNPPVVGGNQAIYEVIISYTGYTAFHGSAEECGIRPDGVVVLSGYLKGMENVDSDDDIMYTGDLEMIIDIDICSATDDPVTGGHKLCGIRVNGSGKVYTELEIYFADDTDRSGSRGGYIKIENKDGRFVGTVTGNCDAAEQDEELTMVPNKSIASVFNGNELPMLLRRTLHVGQYTHTDDEGNITMVEVLRKIR